MHHYPSQQQHFHVCFWCVLRLLGSLDKLLFDQPTPLPEGRILKIVQGIASGMYHLHRNNVVHRDLAARNILLTPSGDPKITVNGIKFIYCFLEHLTHRMN